MNKLTILVSGGLCLAVIVVLFLREPRGSREFWALIGGSVLIVVTSLGIVFARSDLEPLDTVPISPYVPLPTPAPTTSVTTSTSQAQTTFGASSGESDQTLASTQDAALPETSPPTATISNLSPRAVRSMAAVSTATPMFLQAGEPTAPQPQSAPTVVEPTPVTAKIGVLGANVRGSPGFGNNIIGYVNHHDDVILLGIHQGWYFIQLGATVSERSTIDGGRGWVARSVVEPPSKPPPALP